MSTSSNTISSISALLSLSGSQYSVYDIGRRIDEIPNESFQQIESATLPYPYPIQGHALLAISFWQAQSPTPYLWFVKLPLDEQGLLNQGARNHFIAIIIEALGDNLAVNPTEQQEALLKKNPYHFTPAQYKLAAINSLISVAHRHCASQFYIPAMTYLTGENGWHAWQEVGVQGLSDFAFRLNENDNSKILANALPHIPEEVLIPLCAALENIALPEYVVKQLITNLKQALANKNQTITVALLRALSSSIALPLSQETITNLITTKLLDEELLIIIAGRLWPILNSETILFCYLEQLTNENDNALFLAIFKDLVAIPLIRPVLLQVIRSPKRSPALAQAIGMLFKS